MAQLTISETVQNISALFDERLRIKGPVLERQVYKAGRQLPRRVRMAVKNVIDANDVVDHPKLSQRIDTKAFYKSAQVVETHLRGIDPRQVAINKWLGRASKVGLVVVIGFVATIWYLWSEGLV